MATATKTSDRSKQRAPAQGANAGRQTASVMVFDDNAGLYRWEILAADGASLARSGSFASKAQATAAAGLACSGVAAFHASGEEHA